MNRQQRRQRIDRLVRRNCQRLANERLGERLARLPGVTAVLALGPDDDRWWQQATNCAGQAAASVFSHGGCVPTARLVEWIQQFLVRFRFGDTLCVAVDGGWVRVAGNVPVIIDALVTAGATSFLLACDRLNLMIALYTLEYRCDLVVAPLDPERDGPLQAG